MVGAAACGDDDSSSTTTTTTTTPPSTTNPGPIGSASADLCDARDELQSAIGDLTHVDVVKNGTSAVTSALSRIKDDLGAVRTAAGNDLQPQVAAFQHAIDQVQTALTGSGTPQIDAIVSGLRNVGSTGATLVTSLRNLRCP
jgi:hypothetical protein